MIYITSPNSISNQYFGGLEEMKRDESRRKFLRGVGKFAVGAPPLIAVLLSKANVVAAYGNNGFGNGPFDGVPGNSGFTDETR